MKQLEQNVKEFKEVLRKKKNEIDDIYSKDVQRKLIFLKQKYYEGGGKASKLLSYRLKREQAENSIHKITNPITNLIQHKLEDIQNSFGTYFQRLHSQTLVDRAKMEEFFETIHLPKLTE